MIVSTSTTSRRDVCSDGVCEGSVDSGPVEKHDRLAVGDEAVGDHSQRVGVGQLEDLDVLAFLGQ
jgi:hypothetical protein